MSIQDIPGDVLAMADMEGEAMEARQRERARKKIEADRAETLDAQARANSEGGPGRLLPPVLGYDLARYRQAEALRLRMKAVLGTPDTVCMCGIEIDAAMRERFVAKIDPTGNRGCWEWTASLSPKGYGKFRAGKKTMQAHRVSFALAGNTVPEGLQIDHVCRNRKCVNPEHLEAVTGKVNTMRGDTIPARHAARTHCLHGHELTESNLVPSCPYRKCLTCNREAAKAYARWRRANK